MSVPTPPPEPADHELDAVVAHAALACEAPAAALALEEPGRLVLRARHGVQLQELPAPLTPPWPAGVTEPICAEDVRHVPELADHPLLACWPGARLFALAPLVDRQGSTHGALVVLDRRSRPLLAAQRDSLRFLAGHAAALLELRRKLRSFIRLVEALPERLYAFDRRGRCLYASLAGARALGLPPSQLIGHSLDELAAWNLAAARLRPLVERVFETGRPTIHREVAPSEAGVKAVELHVLLVPGVDAVVVQGRED